ncbi:MAG: hypothetical protein V1743_01715 [Nanoarchaeota archaeon]
MKTIYVFGNEHLEYDRMAQLVMRELDDVRAIYCGSPERILDDESDEIIMLDVVKGATKPLIINDVRQLKTRALTTMHDFDVGFFLNLLHELGMEKKIKIIGIPAVGDAKLIAREVKAWI